MSPKILTPGWDGKRICTKCPVPHAENCPECFGFGLHRGTDVPLAARYSFPEHPTPEWDRCPTCGGTPNGITELPTEKEATLND